MKTALVLISVDTFHSKGRGCWPNEKTLMIIKPYIGKVH